MAKQKSQINIYVQRYVEAVFESRLREERFSCKVGNPLCWYRIKGDVIHSIIFFCCDSLEPIVPMVGFGIHPLFQKPAYTPNACSLKRPLTEALLEQPLVENGPINEQRFMLFSNDIQIYAPNIGQRGLYTLDGIILPMMEKATSVSACYQLHKTLYCNGNSGFENIQLSDVFIDEVIWTDDQNLYPYCAKRADNVIAIYQNLCAKQARKIEYEEKLQQWQLRKAALEQNGRNDYMQILEKRKYNNLLYLQNLLGQGMTGDGFA